jgi:hypothetical protein
VLTNPDVSCGGSLVDYFWVVHYTAFSDNYRVNRDCARVLNRASAGEAVSATISKSAATSFSVTIIESIVIIESIGILIESTRTVRAYGTKHQLGKRFHRQFPKRQRLRFRWRLPVNRDCAHRQIQASAGEAVLVMIFELEESHCRWLFPSQLGLFAPTIPTSTVEGVSWTISELSTTLLSVTITESIGTVRTYETDLHLGKQFHWRFPSRQRLCFRWRLSSKQGLPSQQGLLPSQQGLCAYMERSISGGSGFVENFQVGSDSIFGEAYRVNRDCARDKPKHQLGKHFWWWFSSWKILIVGDDFRVNWDCLRWSIRTSAVEAVSLIIFYSSTTLLSVTITES